jgi:hypothetical protein
LERLFAFTADRIGIAETVSSLAVLVAFAGSYALPDAARKTFAYAESILSLVARRRVLSLVVLLFASVFGRLALIPLLGEPQPLVPDEASIILQAQCLAKGHLTCGVKNLPPSMESIYVLISPTYASVYPVLRSFAVATGDALFRNGWLGIILFMSTIPILTYLLLVEFGSRSMAFATALLVMVRICFFSFWINSYFSPVVTAIGALLTVLGVVRLYRRPTLLDGVMFGAGIALMITSRPFEGLAFGAPFVVLALIRLLRSESGLRPALMRAGAAAACVAAAGLCLVLVANTATTGHWAQFPYDLYRTQAARTPALLIGTPTEPPVDRYDQVRRYFDLEWQPYAKTRSLGGLVGQEITRARNYLNFYVGAALMVPFVLGGWALRRNGPLVAGAACLAPCLAMETWPHSHYAVPALPLFVIAIGVGWVTLRGWSPRGRPVGLAFSRWCCVIVILGSIVPVWAQVSGAWKGPDVRFQSIDSACCWLRTRSIHELVERRLARAGSNRNVVFVDTGPSASLEPIVFNDANPDASQTIWAHEDPQFDPVVLQRFPGRVAWRLGWIAHKPCLTPLAGGYRLGRDPQSECSVID